MAQTPDSLQDKLSAIRVLIFDVDGVLTDGGLIVGPDGEEYKRFHVRDGHGIKMLQRSGVDVAVITGRTSSVVSHRCTELGIEHVHQGCDDKLEAFQHLARTLSLEHDQFAYMGDDLIDLPVMRRVGVAMTVANAAESVREHSHWISRYNGGNGAAREACEVIMQSQGTLDAALSRYMS